MKSLFAALLLLTAAPAIAQPQNNDPLLAQRRLAAVVRQTNRLYEAGDYHAALAQLDSLQGDSANDIGVLNLRAAILTKLGDSPAAEKLFQEILISNPNYFPAVFNLGELQFLQGNYKDALESFSAMLAREPRNEFLRFKVALCQLVLGEDDGARKTANQLITAGSTPAWYYAQSLLARKAGNKRDSGKMLSAGRSIYGSDACKLFDESIANLKF